MLERQSRSENEIPTWLNIGTQDWRIGYVRALRWLRCCQYEDDGESRRWGIRAQWDEDVDYECEHGMFYLSNILLI